MQNTWDGDTRGLGAGSYPEPPDLPDQDGPACKECGWQRDLKEVDGRLLCRDCRETYYLSTSTPEEQRDFINSSDELRLMFYRDFWFKTLSIHDQLSLLVRAYADSMMYEKQQDKFSGAFCRKNGVGFCDYMDGEACI